MANNGTPQLLKDIFSYRPNGAVPETLDAAVRQDKARMKSARVASAQPAPHDNVMRPQLLNRKTPRSQNSPNPKRKTVQLTIWVEPIVKGELQRIAKLEGLTVSKVSASFLKYMISAGGCGRCWDGLHCHP
jgi:hypothetical protein